MILRPRLGRIYRSRLLQTLIAAILLWTAVDVFSVQRAYQHEASQKPPPFDKKQKIFIASIHWTDEHVLRHYWVPAVARLAHEIGRENVYISVHESGSFDDTKGALQELDAILSDYEIRRQITLDETTHWDEVRQPPAAEEWLQMPQTQRYRANWTEWFTLEKGLWVPRRIPYLARLRNLVMQPLWNLQQEGEVFDKILWLNDVVFDTADVQRLLATGDGEYAAACALDFKRPPKFYDTFALRDAGGLPPLMETWPFFHSAHSRKAVQRGDPVPVASCWNGMVVFDAAPFYSPPIPLSFRGISDSLAESHLEGSECCLIHADNPLSHTKGVWINPHVRVAYNGTAYHTVNDAPWPSSMEIVKGSWRNRISRWLGLVRLRDPSAEDRIAKWQLQDSDHNREVGDWCVIDEMQILLWNGWGHA